MSCFSSLLRLNVLFTQLCLHFIKHFFFLRGIVLLGSLWMALSFLARQRSLLRIRDLLLCLAAEIGIQHIPGVSNSLGRVRASLFTHANQRSIKGNDVSGFLIRDGSVLALRFRDVSASLLYKIYSSVLFFGLQETPVHL